MPRARNTIHPVIFSIEQEPIFVPKGHKILAYAIEKAAELWHPDIYHKYSSDLELISSANGHEYEKIDTARKRDNNTKENACFIASKTLAKYLYDGSIPAYILAEGHDIKEIPRGFWNSIPALHIINNREVMIDFVGLDFQPVRGVIILKEDSLSYVINQEMANTIGSTNESAETSSGNNNSVAAYSTYIQYMLEASNKLKLVKGRRANGSRMPIQQVKEWLKSNWPTDLGKLTEAKISSMATLMRHPDDENGGNTKRGESQSTADIKA